MSAAQNLKVQIEIKLVVKKGPHAGQRYSFSKPEITIGRAPENDVVLLNDPLISRQHAKLVLVQGELEVINLSQKNHILVGSESVQKWKLVNQGTFQIGDTEFEVEFDLGRSVVAVQHQKPSNIAKPMTAVPQNTQPPQQRKIAIAPQVPAQRQGQIQKNPQAVAIPQNQRMMSAKNQFPQGAVPPNLFKNGNFNYQQSVPQSSSSLSMASEKKKKIRFYAIVLCLAVGVIYYFNSEEPKPVSADKKTLLRYEDDALIKSQKTKNEIDKALKKSKELKDSPTYQRAEENFMKGMRDFQLGNYSRAQEFFQVVLNLQPDHAMAKKHLLLSKIRFDEVLKAKIMLGENYYQKHNFKMCIAMYDQVITMLTGKNNDQNLVLATQMKEKCELALKGYL